MRDSDIFDTRHQNRPVHREAIPIGPSLGSGGLAQPRLSTTPTHRALEPFSARARGG